MAEALQEALEEHLFALEVRPAQLRSDPHGREWLGEEWSEVVRREPELRMVVQRFVEEELELYDSVRGQADAFFTARVIEATSPVEVAGAGLAPRYRSWVLASAYALALGAASVIALPWLQAWLQAWLHGQVGTGGLHSLVSHDRGEPSEHAWWTLVAVALVVAVTMVAMRVATLRGPTQVRKIHGR